MKYFLYIFTYLLLGASCSSPSRPIDYGTELTATDSICLSIDEHTHYESKSIFQFEENGHEYLSFLNEKASYKVHIYDLDTKQVIKTIHLQKEGRNAMPSTNGCFPLSSKLFLFSTSPFSLIIPKTPFQVVIKKCFELSGKQPLVDGIAFLPSFCR